MVKLDVYVPQLRRCRFWRVRSPNFSPGCLSRLEPFFPSRPFLFRSTSYDVLKFFRSAPHIHADVLSQDAWDRGVIKSDTDYSVYAAPRIQNASRFSKDGAAVNATGHGYEGPGGGMQGADIAFYRSRSRYHTMDDSIRGMGEEGAMRSLWALMELLLSVGDTILNTKTGDDPSDESERAVYFEGELLRIDLWPPSSLMIKYSIRHLSHRLSLPRLKGYQDSAPCCGPCDHCWSRIPSSAVGHVLYPSFSHPMAFVFQRLRPVLVSPHFGS
jgi:hypothetical protein